MMAEKQLTKNGLANIGGSGMLSKINKHFFPNIDSVEQEFIYIYDEITVENCASAIQDILSLNKKTYSEDAEGNVFEDPMPDVINLMLTTQGGDMSAALALINIMRASSIPIRTIALGETMSAGLVILMAGHQRVLTPYATLMSHIFSTGTEGTYHQLKNAMEEIKRTNQRMIDFYVEFTGLDAKYIKRKFLGLNDAYISPESAIKHNMIDLISDLR